MRARAVVIVAIGLIALAAVYAARQRSRPADASAAEQIQPLVTVDDRARLDAAHVAVCEAIQGTVDASMEFDRDYAITPHGSDNIRLTTTALIEGRPADVLAVLQWDDERRTWDILEVSVGGTAVPIQSGGGP